MKKAYFKIENLKKMDLCGYASEPQISITLKKDPYRITTEISYTSPTET